MSNLSDNDVNEATAALKGMLGIGSGSAGPTPSKSAGGKPKGAKQGRKGIKRLQSVAANKTIEASPDASALPIPAFVSPVNSATGDESSTQLDPSQLISLLSRSGDQQLNPVPVEIINAPRAEDLEAQQIAEAEKAKGATPQVESQLDANTQNEQALQEEAKPVSEKGINLAALAASPTSNPQYPPRVHGAGLLAPPPTPFSSPQLPPRYLSHGHFSSPPPQQLPQSYVTMQVQVPPILGPDRRLVVHSPAGYPVQILIPDGVPPGMVIPVHVPTSPMIPSPYYAQHQQQPQPFVHPQNQYYGSPSPSWRSAQAPTSSF
ncbi:hypothetical protein MHU86_19274 [Fragilaria crotonensis]|nr:hypothetical protein MHU86_19274 [Fragilaria crotonensis]